jgi:hypothetical protein
VTIAMTEMERLRTAGRLAARVEMRDVRVVRSSADTQRLPQPGLPLAYHQDVDPSVQMDAEENLLMVEIGYSLSITQAIDESDVDIAQISASFAALYQLTPRADDAPFSEEEVLAFASTTGVLGLHPFWREFVYSMTGRMALPPLTLGIFQVEFRPDDDLRPLE